MNNIKALWRNAFVAWFCGVATFYSTLVLPLTMFLFWDRGPVLEMSMIVVMAVSVITIVSALSAWAAVVGYLDRCGRHRRWALRVATRMGWKLVICGNPVWILYMLGFVLREELLSLVRRARKKSPQGL